ncbi:phosphoenolpyruvate--protein phosphotransferase [Neomegalonema perideroedes]|uniref:phosphoenolpyruvate--protein phosphotransferase n=1 Tax=Neomegalonema perideroedes TaxID=217219 RepID=UPI000361D548|nr:phosphoenolpyruvate--protein phosphotransferase [Neomegalonema perideroedes]
MTGPDPAREPESRGSPKTAGEAADTAGSGAAGGESLRREGAAFLFLRQLREALTSGAPAQERLDAFVARIAGHFVAEVCSFYALRGSEILELYASQGLNADSVRRAQLRVGEGLVGLIARDRVIVNAPEAREHPAFRYLPETREEEFSSFLGVPVKSGTRLRGVLVVQNRVARRYTEDEIAALETFAAVLAETAGPAGLLPRGGQRAPAHLHGTAAAEGVAIGVAALREPPYSLPNPVAQDAEAEQSRLREAMESLRGDLDRLLESEAAQSHDAPRDVLEAFRLFAQDKSWMRRIEQGVSSGLTAEAAVDQARADTRAKLARVSDPYIRARFDDLDDLAERLIRKLLGVREIDPEDLPENAILIARALGPGELLDYGRERLKGVVLEEGSSGAHAAIVAKSLGIPMVVQARGALESVEQGDPIIISGDQGQVHLRPHPDVLAAFRDKIALKEQERAAFAPWRRLPAVSLDGRRIRLFMNAGILADLPSLRDSGAEGVGLLRTELQFFIRARLPRRSDQEAFYRAILKSSAGKRVVFRTLDVGSDKVLPYLNLQTRREENPALGWRALRVGLDRPALLKMQLQSLVRAAEGGPLTVMFPMVAEREEFQRAKALLMREIERLAESGTPRPSKLEVGAMLETPSLAYAHDDFLREADFLSIGGNDLAQFFFAADRGNDRVAWRYGALKPSFLRFIREICGRCSAFDLPLSFCGEAAAKPVAAVALAALGVETLSMRPASIAPIKRAIRSVNLGEAREVIDAALARDAYPEPELAALLARR